MSGQTNEHRDKQTYRQADYNTSTPTGDEEIREEGKC